MQGNGVRMAIFLFKWIGGEREREKERSLLIVDLMVV